MTGNSRLSLRTLLVFTWISLGSMKFHVQDKNILQKIGLFGGKKSTPRNSDMKICLGFDEKGECSDDQSIVFEVNMSEQEEEEEADVYEVMSEEELSLSPDYRRKRLHSQMSAAGDSESNHPRTRQYHNTGIKHQKEGQSVQQSTKFQVQLDPKQLADIAEQLEEEHLDTSDDLQSAVGISVEGSPQKAAFVETSRGNKTHDQQISQSTQPKSHQFQFNLTPEDISDIEDALKKEEILAAFLKENKDEVVASEPENVAGPPDVLQVANQTAIAALRDFDVVVEEVPVSENIKVGGLEYGPTDILCIVAAVIIGAIASFIGGRSRNASSSSSVDSSSESAKTVSSVEVKGGAVVPVLSEGKRLDHGSCGADVHDYYDSVNMSETTVVGVFEDCLVGGPESPETPSPQGINQQDKDEENGDDRDDDEISCISSNCDVSSPELYHSFMGIEEEEEERGGVDEERGGVEEELVFAPISAPNKPLQSILRPTSPFKTVSFLPDTNINTNTSISTIGEGQGDARGGITSQSQYSTGASSPYSGPAVLLGAATAHPREIPLHLTNSQGHTAKQLLELALEQARLLQAMTAEMRHGSGSGSGSRLIPDLEVVSTSDSSGYMGCLIKDTDSIEMASKPLPPSRPDCGDGSGRNSRAPSASRMGRLPVQEEEMPSTQLPTLMKLSASSPPRLMRKMFNIEQAQTAMTRTPATSLLRVTSRQPSDPQFMSPIQSSESFDAENRLLTPLMSPIESTPPARNGLESANNADNSRRSRPRSRGAVRSTCIGDASAPAAMCTQRRQPGALSAEQQQQLQLLQSVRKRDISPSPISYVLPSASAKATTGIAIAATIATATNTATAATVLTTPSSERSPRSRSQGLIRPNAVIGDCSAGDTFSSVQQLSKRPSPPANNSVKENRLTLTSTPPMTPTFDDSATTRVPEFQTPTNVSRGALFPSSPESAEKQVAVEEETDRDTDTDKENTNNSSEIPVPIASNSGVDQNTDDSWAAIKESLREIKNIATVSI